MAAVQIQNGQQIANPATETEVQITAPYARKIYFLVSSGTVQVTNGPRGETAVIGGNIHAFATSEGLQRMTIEPANGATEEGTSIYIKGSGTIYFTW